MASFFPPLLACGLHPVQGSTEDYPLSNAKVHYDLSDVQMLANLVQTYTSNASVANEIRYVFPLPPDASVCSFKAVLDGKRTIKGVIKEKAQAAAEYEQAVAKRKTAALLQQGTVEVFQVSLGNIRPQQTIEVHISFVSIIAHDGSLDSLRLNFPSAIAPRYGTQPRNIFDPPVPAWSRSGSFRSALEFSVAVDMTSQIKSITSPSHPIAMKFGESSLKSSSEFDPTKARVSLSSPTLLEKDIVIILTCGGLDKPRCMVESFSPEEGGQDYTDAYALTLVPRFEVPPLPSQEYIFLVDRSGSMGHDKMDAVRSALQIMLVSLPARGTSLNIVSFGTRHTLLWPSSVAYSADSVKEASSHVDTMSSNYGGTEIRSAIEAAFASRSIHPEGQNTPTSVFILTDGQASDLDGVRSSIQQAVTKAKKDNLLLRVFCMGIGNAVSKAMCDTIARAGQGTAVFVGEQEKPDQKLMGLLRAARGAIVEDISIDCGVDDHDPAEEDGQDFEMVSAPDAAPISLFNESHITTGQPDLGPQAVASIKLPPPPRVQQAPPSQSLPPLYPGFRTNVFAIVRRGGGGNTAPSKTLCVKGSVLGRPVVLEVPVIPISKPEVTTDEGPQQIKMLHVLAARALIQSFEDKAVDVKSDVDKAEVLRLAVRYGLASSQTSFLAVDEQGEPVDVVRNVVKTATAGTHVTSTARGPPFAQAVCRAAVPSRSADRAGALPTFGGAMFGALSTSIGLFGSQSQQMGDSSERMAHSPPASGSFLFGSSSPSSLESPQSLSSPHASPTPTIGEMGMHRDKLRSEERGVIRTEIYQTAQLRQLPQGQQRQLPQGQQQQSTRNLSLPLSPATQISTVFGATGAQSGSQVLPPTVESLARAQSFDGSFVSSPQLFQLLVQQPEAPTMPAALGTADASREKIWCTLLCVVYLESKFLDEKDVWAMIVEKAMAWAEDILRDVVGATRAAAVGQELKDEARRCII